MRRLSLLSCICLLGSWFTLACGSSDESEDTNAGEESTSQSFTETETETETETGAGDSVCYPEGIYGPCSGENIGCQCLGGLETSQVCTAPCVDDADCGDPADFPGAIPHCIPISGMMEKVCSLACTNTADCPCGLTCRSATGSCGESFG